MLGPAGGAQKKKGRNRPFFGGVFMLPVGLADVMGGTLLCFASPVNCDFRIGFAPNSPPRPQKNRAF